MVQSIRSFSLGLGLMVVASAFGGTRVWAQTAIDSPLADCSTLTIAGTWACSFEGEDIELNVKRAKNQFTLSISVAQQTQSETYVADGKRRNFRATQPSRSDEYIATCRTDSQLQVVGYVGSGQDSRSLLRLKTDIDRSGVERLEYRLSEQDEAAPGPGDENVTLLCTRK